METDASLDRVPIHDHPPRCAEPMVRVQRLAGLRFVRADLDRAQRFALDFGLSLARTTTERVELRGSWEGPTCVTIEAGASDRFLGPVFEVATRDELDALAEATCQSVRPLDDAPTVVLVDPSGLEVRVCAGLPVLPPLPERDALPLNVGRTVQRVNSSQRPRIGPATIQRLGHLVLETTRARACIAWYRDVLGMVVSDYLYLQALPERGPTMAFLRCDRGSRPVDHHTLAIHLGLRDGLSHVAFQVVDLDAIATGGAHLAARGYHHSWGIGRHVEGSQLFDYWRDPSGDLFELYADGDLFDVDVPPQWTPMGAKGLSQWGPPVNADFLGTGFRPSTLVQLARALSDPDNEVDRAAVSALMKVMSP